MKKLGILINQDDREEGRLDPAYPHLAFSYYRSGYIRLAGVGRKHRK